MTFGNNAYERQVANLLTSAMLEPNAKMRMVLKNREKWPAYAGTNVIRFNGQNC